MWSHVHHKIGVNSSLRSFYHVTSTIVSAVDCPVKNVFIIQCYKKNITSSGTTASTMNVHLFTHQSGFIHVEYYQRYYLQGTV